MYEPHTAGLQAGRGGGLVWVLPGAWRDVSHPQHALVRDTLAVTL